MMWMSSFGMDHGRLIMSMTMVRHCGVATADHAAIVAIDAETAAFVLQSSETLFLGVRGRAKNTANNVLNFNMKLIEQGRCWPPCCTSLGSHILFAGDLPVAPLQLDVSENAAVIPNSFRFYVLNDIDGSVPTQVSAHSCCVCNSFDWFGASWRSTFRRWFLRMKFGYM